MNTIPFPEAAGGIEVGYKEMRFTQPHEVQCLCWLARQTKGAILEIGCNEGRTTRDLALANPDRLVVGVDYTGRSDTMCPAQKGEKPRPEAIGYHARMLPNVRIVNAKSADMQQESSWPTGERFGFVFIDGDHSYQGVKSDTEIALRLLALRQGCSGCRALIAWHDCNEDAPPWVQVSHYLETEVVPRFTVERVQGTWLAVLELRA